MKFPNPAGLIGVGKAFVAANRPEILLGTSVISTISAVVMAARGGYKSGYTVAEEDIKRKVVGADVLTPKEIAQLTWLNYLPAAGGLGVALGSTTGLHLVHVQEKKQLAAATIIAMDQVQKEAVAYKKELLESVGQSKSDDPKDLDKASKKSGVVAVPDSDGHLEERYLVRDVKTGRDIWSNKRLIEEAVLALNQRLANDAVEMNQFYSEAGFNSIPDGEEYGWNAGSYVGLEWDTTVSDDGRPVRTFLFATEPSTRLWDVE